MKPTLTRLALIAGALLLLVAALAWQFQRSLSSPGPLAAPLRISIASGASLRTSLRQLAEAQVLSQPRALEWWLRLRSAPPFQSGTYDFAARASANTVLRQLQRGEFAYEQLTIIEGWTFRQMRALLDASPHLRHSWRELGDAELMGRLEHAGLHPEGQFFPDTYRFVVGSPDADIYRLAFTRAQQELAAAWEQRAADLPLRTPQEALILASVIEKESGREDERPLVAAVFVNRLRIGMRLQSDPTIIYGLGEKFDGDLRTRDLRTDGPYNSRTRAGLPPTPIALVSRAALRATLQPARSRALYFVASGAGDGRHYFSSSLVEHNQAVQRYLRRTGARR